MIWFFVSVVGWLGLILSRKFYGLPFLFLITTMSAFRYYVGSDFDNYVGLFNLAAEGYLIPVELSYSLISLFLSSIGLNFQAIIALYALLTYLFIYLGLKEISSDKEFLGFTIFFVYLIFYFPSLSIMRQCLSASIAFWGVYRYLFRGQNLRFLLTIIAASLFHLSSIIFVLCFPFYMLRPKKGYYYLGIGIAALLGVTVFGSLMSLIQEFTGFGYKGYQISSRGFPPPIFLINTFVLGVGFLIVLNSTLKKDYFLLNTLCFIFVLRLLSLDFLTISRLGQAFLLFIPVFLYQLLFLNLKSNSKWIFFVILVPVFLIKDGFRAAKDYSYFQYSVNFCIYDEPCPISIIGDVPLEDLKIPELER